MVVQIVAGSYVMGLMILVVGVFIPLGYFFARTFKSLPWKGSPKFY